MLKTSALIALLLAAGPLRAQTTLRVWGFDQASPLVERWEAAYTRQHPDVHFTNSFHGPASAMAGMYNGVADIVVMGREIWPVDTMAYHWVYQRQPFGVAVVTSGTDAPSQSFSPVVIVNRANPLTGITLAQLDAIYGSEHRAAPADITTWGELGLAGPWAARPIHPVGYGPEDALGVYFRHDILKSDFKPNPASVLLSDRDPEPKRGSLPSAAQRIASRIAADPEAIGYTSAASLPAGVKVLPVEGIPANAGTLSSHAYPMTRSLSLYVNRQQGKPLPPAIDSFLHFVLSPAGQAEVRASEGYLSLTAALAQQQQQRLDDPMPPEPKAAAAADSQ